MPKESFVVYLDFEKTLRQFTQEEALEMFWAFFEYNRTGVVPTFSSRLLEVCWIRFQTQFDRDAEKYENVCNRNRRNGMCGGRPAKPKEPNGFFDNPNNPNGFEKPKKADNDNDNDNDNDIKKNIINNTKKSVFGFDEFWEAYGKKVGKKNCQKMYDKISEQEREKIKAHVPQYVASKPEKKYRKDPQTYLKGECWNDEIICNVSNNMIPSNGNVGFDRKNRATHPGDENAGKEFTNGF